MYVIVRYIEYNVEKGKAKKIHIEFCYVFTTHIITFEYISTFMNVACVGIFLKWY